MAESCGEWGPVKEIRRLQERLEEALSESESITAILNGADGALCKADGQQTNIGVEDRLDSLHKGMEVLQAQLVEIRKRVQAISRQL